MNKKKVKAMPKPAQKSVNNLAMGCMVVLIILALTLHIVINFILKLF